MPYVVKAGSGNLGERTVTLHKETRFAALETALGLVEQGIAGVTITVPGGRVYAASELRDFLNEDF
jgi:hypothetical protein